ncbi:Endonuclease/exonuclease/phosphatase [Cunninghamella echinulata]|nr:Endonuclease/exonuclease/phosphatase [Cunninghamella echinulata]
MSENLNNNIQQISNTSQHTVEPNEEGYESNNNSDNNNDNTTTETSRLLQPNQQHNEPESQSASMVRSYSVESVVSTQSAPPPYELYAPARTALGRFYNWLRKIPTLATHQAIYLPTLPIRRNRSQQSAFYNHHNQHLQQGQSQQQQRVRADSLSSSSIHSFSSSNYPTTLCTRYYYQLCDFFANFPKYVLPSPLGQYRGVMIGASFFLLLLCCFLLFCSIFFAPADLPPKVLPDKILLPGQQVDILTLNIFMRPPLIKNNEDDYKDERLDYIIQYILPKYDIIAFQESFAFATRRKDKLIQQARLRYGFNYHIESPRKFPWDITVDGGLLIISKYPIIQSDIIQYPRGVHSDWLSSKGALHALIELNQSTRFHLFTTHTQASYDLNNVINQEDTFIRLEQFALLHELISETTSSEYMTPIMILGDLNVDAAVHGPQYPLTYHSKESSKQYTMLKDVLVGNGVKGSEFGLDDEDVLFAHPWVIKDLTDVVYENYGYHPVTFGDIDLIYDSDNGAQKILPGETILTDHEQLKTVQSIDRIFWSSRKNDIMHINNIKVEPFKVKDNNELTDQQKEDIPFTQISDHYGISCSIQI